MTIIYVTSIIGMLLVMLLLSIKILLTKKGEFPSSHVGAQKALRDKGISCHTSQHHEMQAHLSLRERIEARNKVEK